MCKHYWNVKFILESVKAVAPTLFSLFLESSEHSKRSLPTSWNGEKHGKQYGVMKRNVTFISTPSFTAPIQVALKLTKRFTLASVRSGLDLRQLKSLYCSDSNYTYKKIHVTLISNVVKCQGSSRKWENQRQKPTQFALELLEEKDHELPLFLQNYRYF